MLPVLPNKDGISKWRSVDFRGIRHTLGAQTGDIWDCKGVVPDDYPVLRTVDWTKYKYDANNKGIYGSYQYGVNEIERIYVNAGALFYRDTQVYADAGLNAKQSITAFNTYALIFPAKVFIRTDVKALCATAGDLPSTPAYGDVYAVASGSTYEAKYWDGTAWVSLGDMAGKIETSDTASCTFTDGTYAGEEAEANTIKRASGTWTGFNVGDAVTISGAADEENNKTIIIREIENDELRFYENSFTVNSTAANITVARTVPDMDWLCVNENRVWGCKGQHIYASKLGDMRNWNVFDGIASDSYAVDVLTGGDFTGCVSFLGYPVFFKRDAIYKVYGNRPSNFEVMGSASTGTVNGDTLAIASETLFYLSTRGIMAYSGGIPALVSGDLGDFITGSESAWGTTDGRKYYFGYPVTGTGTISNPVYEYDPEKFMWHKQIYPATINYGYRGHKGAVFVTSAGHRYGDITGTGSLSNAFLVEFADMTEDVNKYPQYGANKKGTSKIQVRMALGASSTVTISMKFDSTGDWITVKSFTTANVKKSFYLPIIPRRSDHFRIKFEGTGHFELYSLARENYKGSAI